MAKNIQPSPRERREIAQQLGILLQNPHYHHLALPGQTVELETALDLWMLPVDKIALPIRRLVECAHSTGFWHHQVLVDGAPKVMLRSALTDSTPPRQLIQFFGVTPLASFIDSAIAWLDRHDQSDALVRLLAVPGLHLDALWIADPKKPFLLVLRSPNRFAKLPLLTPVSERVFLSVLARDPEPIG